MDRPNQTLIKNLKQSLNIQFKLKDMGTVQYFLGLEATYIDKRIILSQQQSHYVSSKAPNTWVETEHHTHGCKQSLKQ